MKVVSIQTKHNKDAVKVLEDALVKAKSGEYIAVSVSWITKDTAVCGQISEGKDGFIMLASMENTIRAFKQLIFGDP